MSKPKTKAQASAEQAPTAVKESEKEPGPVVTGNDRNQADPAKTDQPVDKPVEQVAAKAAHQPVAQEPEDLIDALVLCDGSLDGVTRYRAGQVLQGLPESLAEAHSHWLDVHPSAVEHALDRGAAVIDYQQKA